MSSEVHVNPVAYKEPVPKLLKVVERLLTGPDELAAIAAAERVRAELAADNAGLSDWRIKAAKRIISRYSNRAALVGGATGALAIVPGIGTLAGGLGGAGADTAMTLKWQTEMGLALAALYGHDLTNADIRERIMFLAGLGTIAGGGKTGRAGQISTQAFVDFAQQRFQRYSVHLLRRLFTQMGTRAGRKTLEKIAPFGVGIVLGGSINKVGSKLVGERMLAFLEAMDVGEASWQIGVDADVSG